MSKRKYRDGAKRERCIAMLEELGFQVIYCRAASGYWRQKRADVYCWEFHGILNGVQRCGGCWESMTECVKAGKLYWHPREDEVSTWPAES